MVNTGDNTNQTESEDERQDRLFQVYAAQECINCTHKRRSHFDRAGCTEVSQDADPEVNSFPRCHCTNFDVAVKEDRTVGVSKYVVDDINNIDQVRKYIRLNEKFLTDEQALVIQTQMGLFIDPPNSWKQCYFCHHAKGYHKDPELTMPQLPCNFTWDDEGQQVNCLCYGWCETKEEADALVDEGDKK